MRSGRRGGSLPELLVVALAVLCFAGSAWHERVSPPPFVPAERAPDVVRLVTWNVGSGMDGRMGGLQDDDVEHVAQRLVALDPDIVLLQELIRPSQLWQLRRSLGAGWKAEIAGRVGTRRVGVLARGIMDVFEETSDGRLLGVQVLTSHGAIDALAVHADAFSAEERNRLLGRAADLLLARPASEAVIRVLAGDLNLDLDLGKRRDLFTDDEYLDVETYNYLSEHLEDAAAQGGSTAEPDRRLDYLLFDSTTYRVQASGPWKRQRANGMDHDPVVLDLAPR